MNQAVKQFDNKNQIWYTHEGKHTHIGFTTNFLEVVKESFHVMQASRGTIREKSPLLAIETNDRLFAIPSPVSGNIISFNAKAQNFPDKLTENDVVCIIGDEKVAEEEIDELDQIARQNQDFVARVNRRMEQAQVQIRANEGLRQRAGGNIPREAVAGNQGNPFARNFDPGIPRWPAAEQEVQLEPIAPRGIPPRGDR